MKNKNNDGLNRRDFLSKASLAFGSIMIVPRHVLGGKRPDGSSYLAPSDVLNLGFIGTGKQGRGLSNSFLSTGQVRISAISEVYQAKANLFLDRVKENYAKNPSWGAYAAIPVYQDYRELLASKNVDAVVIATPDHWHAAMAVRAAEAGKDIYCEKPLSLTVKEGRAMVNAARKHKRVFQTGSMQRSWPEFRQAVELIRNGYIGEVKSIKVNVGPPPEAYQLPAQSIPEGLDFEKWLGPNEAVAFNTELAPPITQDVFPNWRKYKEFGGGGMTDWGAHMFDIVQWALDMDQSGPVKVSAPQGKDQPYLTYTYANGITMTHQPWEWNSGVEFVGTEGTLRSARKKLETSKPELKDRVIGPNEKHVYKSENHYVDFIQAIRNRTMPICDVEVGHRTASVCNIGNIAYAVNKSLEWNPKSEKFNDADANALLGRKLNKTWGIKI
ncbi:Gfo/Idh/MocA family protein [Aquirufa ecclesiirivi]|uniref:Gfo/Idh/MocA family protein n=1 Tax=Aquirufa ecclesiirivi TaxID=2715124 RepID=UPI00140DB935|nr:Gfo/Idh/MocA family oxidoreductase [Aquirufa ecclesiirivi]MDF0694469.1 Gfo/Idh/MocA family oxidoreductase [Aquirufa ecclesiirivi]NHC48954.1 Gfo/Idh/MocA family oxidoreductase [Aquirufa ecclesiirivi]